MSSRLERSQAKEARYQRLTDQLEGETNPGYADLQRRHNNLVDKFDVVLSKHSRRDTAVRTGYTGGMNLIELGIKKYVGLNVDNLVERGYIVWDHHILNVYGRRLRRVKRRATHK